jgi:hypothetical protein
MIEIQGGYPFIGGVRIVRDITKMPKKRKYPHPPAPLPNGESGWE